MNYEQFISICTDIWKNRWFITPLHWLRFSLFVTDSVYFGRLCSQLLIGRRHSTTISSVQSLYIHFSCIQIKNNYRHSVYHGIWAAKVNSFQRVISVKCKYSTTILMNLVPILSQIGCAVWFRYPYTVHILHAGNLDWSNRTIEVIVDNYQSYLLHPPKWKNLKLSLRFTLKAVR